MNPAPPVIRYFTAPRLGLGVLVRIAQYRVCSDLAGLAVELGTRSRDPVVVLLLVAIAEHRHGFMAKGAVHVVKGSTLMKRLRNVAVPPTFARYLTVKVFDPAVRPVTTIEVVVATSPLAGRFPTTPV